MPAAYYDPNIGRHAYLIIAHNEFGVLKKLVALLDNPANDIYIHIDRRAKEFDFDGFSRIAKKSNLYFIERLRINWGGYSQVKCEMSLLKASVPAKYTYYHLLSGVDLPLRTQKEVHDFFRRNEGYEFISFDHAASASKDFLERIKFYHLFRDSINASKDVYSIMLRIVEKLSLQIQQIVKINRIRKSIYDFQKGTNWFSITHALASYVISQEDRVREYCRFSKCADEIFLHTIAWNSRFRDKIVDDSLRYIDWQRGSPHIFTKDDYCRLIGSGELFARKFSESVDSEIVQRIYRYVSQYVVAARTS